MIFLLDLIKWRMVLAYVLTSFTVNLPCFRIVFFSVKTTRKEQYFKLKFPDFHKAKTYIFFYDMYERNYTWSFYKIAPYVDVDIYCFIFVVSACFFINIYITSPYFISNYTQSSFKINAILSDNFHNPMQ